jgi:predicted HTH domain antitoxin
MSYKLTINIPEDAFSVLRTNPDEFARELLFAALSKWYEEGKISQSKAAEIANISRVEFLEILKDHGISPFQVSEEELKNENELLKNSNQS